MSGHLVWRCFVENEEGFGRIAGDGGDDTAAIGELSYPLGWNVGNRAGGQDAIVGRTLGEPGVAIGGDQCGLVSETVEREPGLVDECGIDI